MNRFFAPLAFASYLQHVLSLLEVNSEMLSANEQQFSATILNRCFFLALSFSLFKNLARPLQHAFHWLQPTPQNVDFVVQAIDGRKLKVQTTDRYAEGNTIPAAVQLQTSSKPTLRHSSI